MIKKSLTDNFLNNYEIIKENIKIAAQKSGRNYDDITILAATKTVDTELINFAINSGITYIGENRVQELISKENAVIPVHKHLIGHLQTNKVKDIIDRVEMIESVDSLKLAKAISNEAKKQNINVDVLLEVNIAGEESKYGFKPTELEENIRKIAILPNIFVKGLMSIPPICKEKENNRKYFKKMYNLFIDISTKKIDNINMDILSMGMSSDYDVAVSEGANLVRIGTALFGERNYPQKPNLKEQ